MTGILRRCCDSKRECMTYLVMLLWIGLGVLGFSFDTNYTHLAAYFLSLTGFIMSYMFGESYRQSKDSSIFMSGKTSKREAIMYLTIAMWTAIGVYGVIETKDLMALSAYFAALTPFVGAYVIADSVKSEGGSTGDIQQLNS